VPTIKLFNSEYERTREVAKRLLKPSWVKRYHGGDEEEATKRLANDYGFAGRINYMRQLCNLLEYYPDQDEFEEAVQEYHQAGLRVMANRLAHCEITDDPTLQKRDAPLSELIGDCYRLAYYFVLHDAPEGAHLVHGHIREGGASSHYTGHAWVELPGDIVYDGVLQRFYRCECYYATRHARRSFAFLKVDAVETFFQYHHFGPWDG